MVLLRNNLTNLRQPTADRPFEIPKVGIGLRFYPGNADTSGTGAVTDFTYNTVKLYSDHISSNCYVPVTNGVGDNLTIEFAPGESGMTLDLTGTGAGKLDTGTVTSGKFYDIRVISKRGSSAALLAHNSGRLEPGLSFGISSVTAASPTVITVSGTHSVQTGESVTISGSAISGLNATRVATRISDTTFSVPYNNGGGATDPGVNAVFTGGSFTMPSGYTHYSDVVFGVSYTAAAVATFTFSGIPDDPSTLTLIDNYTYGSEATIVFELDENASGGAGDNVEIDPSTVASTAAGCATATVAAINAQNSAGNLGITAIDYGSGQVVLYQDSDSAYPGAGSGATAIATNVSAHWNTKTSVNVPSAFTPGGIKLFVQTGPGECLYSTGGGGSIGAGLNVLYGGAAHTETAAIDISRVCPSPVADTAYESRGTCTLLVEASNTNASTAVDCGIYFSADGRLSNDGNFDDSLEVVATLANLRANSSYAFSDTKEIEFPLSVSKTVLTTTTSGTLALILQYKFSASAATSSCTVYVKGWKLNG